MVLDTIVFVSALLAESSLPDQLVGHWRRGEFVLLSAALQLVELKDVTRYPKIRTRIKAAVAGRLMNDLRKIAVMVDPLPAVDASRDPFDNYLLAIALGGEADFLVTGDKPGLLSLRQHERTKIVSVRDFMRFGSMLS